jgi:hypothetical protein
MQVEHLVHDEQQLESGALREVGHEFLSVTIDQTDDKVHQGMALIPIDDRVEGFHRSLSSGCSLWKRPRK